MADKYYLHRFTHCRATKEKGVKVLWNNSIENMDMHEMIGDSKTKMMKDPILIMRKNNYNLLCFDIMIESQESKPEIVKVIDDRIMKELDSKFKNGWVSIIDVNTIVQTINERMEVIMDGKG